MAKTKNKQIKVPIDAFNAMRKIALEGGHSESKIYRDAIGEYLAARGIAIDMTVEVGNPNLRITEEDIEENKKALMRNAQGRIIEAAA